jgi:hypothetical protein
MEPSVPPPRWIAPERKELPRMKGVLLWVIGIPIPVIILLYVFHVIN